MKYLQAVIGHVDLIFHDPTSGPMSKPIAANAPTTKGAMAMPVLSDVDKRHTLQEALRRTFKQLDPHGQVVNESELPQLMKVYSEHLTYRREGRLWRDGYVLNPDGTATLGGVPVPVIEVETERDAAIAGAVADFYQPLRAAGDIAPAIIEIRARDSEKGVVTVLAAGEYREMPYLFDKGMVLVSGGRVVERDGATFRPPSNKTGADVVAATDMIIAAVRKMGRQIRYGDAQIIAAQLTDLSCPTKRELEPLLGKVFAMIEAEERRQPAKRGGTR